MYTMTTHRSKTFAVLLVATLLVVGASAGAIASGIGGTGAPAAAQETTTEGEQSEPVSIQNLTAPEEVAIGEPFTVSAEIVNDGDSEVVRRVTYRIEGNVINSEFVEVGAGNTTGVSFNVTEANTTGFPTGTFTHGVFTEDAEATANLTLVDGDEATTTEAEEEAETTTEADAEEDVETTTEAEAEAETTTEAEEEAETTTEAEEEAETTTEVEEEAETTTEAEAEEEAETTTEAEAEEDAETTTEAEAETETTTEAEAEEEAETTTEAEEEAETTTEVEEEAETTTEVEAEEAATEASVTFENQTSNGSAVTVASIAVPDGGFVVIHDANITEGRVVESIRGSSEFLEAGAHENVTVELSESLNETQELFAVAYRDADENETFDYVTSNRTIDGPYTRSDGIAINDPAVVTVESDEEPDEAGTTTVAETTTEVEEAAETTTELAALRAQAETTTEAGEENQTTPEVQVEAEPETTTEADAEEEVETTTEADAEEEVETTTEADAEEEVETTTEAEEEAETTTEVEEEPEAEEAEVTEANVTFENQTSNGSVVTVASVAVPDGGFVVIHDENITEGVVIESIRGHSEFLEAGAHENVTVELNVSLNETQELFAVAYRDEDENGTFDYVASNRTIDGPYTQPDGEAINDPAVVTVESDEEPDEAETTTVAETTTEAEEEDAETTTEAEEEDAETTTEADEEEEAETTTEAEEEDAETTTEADEEEEAETTTE